CGDCFLHSPAQEALPKALQAGPRDREVLMAMLVKTGFEQEPKNAPKIERSIYEMALFTMPGAQPIGIYRVVGAPIDANWRAMSGGIGPDQNKDLSIWLTRYIDAPDIVSRESAVK